MFKRIMSFGFGCCLLLAILLLSACSDSSDSSGVSKSWSSLDITDSHDLQSVRAIGSKIYAGGLAKNGYVSLRIFENNVQTAHLNVAETLGVNWGIYDDPDGNIYLGWTGPNQANQGHVSKYDPSTGAITDTGLTGAESVDDVYWFDGKCYAAGIDSDGGGRVWRYDGSTWTSTGDSWLCTVDKLVSFKDTLYIAGGNGGTCLAEICDYQLDIWIPVTDLDNNASVIWAFTADSSALYAGGYAPDLSGKVWKYDGNSWSDLNIQNCDVINALRVSSDGILYAGGIDSNGNGQVWMYEKYDNTWTSTGLTHSVTVNDLTEASNGAIYAVGLDSNRNGQMWKYE